jgi:superfamily II DNA/RNA helicase
MKYTDIYINAKRRTKEALLFMWAAGKQDTQQYLDKLFEEEPILAEPIFQSMFPWKSDTRRFDELTNIFDNDFINALSGIEDGKYRFPKDRKPYIHQAQSWTELLENKKSIVVTSGTGSGKTECFMLPIIQDLVRQQQTEYGKDKKCGIQAIFLYPLNALMSSQQKRMSAWCKSVNPQVSFAMYKGDTEETCNANITRNALPELISRNQIRATPPQILFTNPTMLEYMLVRKQDKPILEISKKKKSLRWIVLDEAHTYSGSLAAELALQIRRILDAFGVPIEEVHFAVTSATLGSGSDEEYKSFLSQVTGKKQDEIVVIHGNQILPDISSDKLETIIPEINRNFAGNFSLSKKELIALREELKSNAMSAREIASRFSIMDNLSIEDSLLLIDRLSEKNTSLLSDIDRRGALLPTRAHFFVRNMGGLYACVNPECTKHKDARISLGSLTTIAQTECSECHSKLIEVNRCNACGNLLLVGKEQNGFYDFAKQEKQSLFEMGNDDNYDENTEHEVDKTIEEAISFVIAKGVKEKPINNSSLIPKIIDVREGKISAGEGDFVECRKENGTIICPHCGELTDKLQSMYSGSLFSRLLAPTLLEQTTPETDKPCALWQGRKYISFTDNRQGTAKSTFQQNIDVERNWIRTAIYHYLANERRGTISIPQKLTDLEEKELNVIKQFNPNSPRVIELEQKKNGNPIPGNLFKTYTDFANAIIGNGELSKLYSHLPTSFRIGRDETDYLQQLMIDQFGRRPRKTGVNNPETMGFVRIVYPVIENTQMPDMINGIFDELGWKVNDWRDFLKISLDYFFRENKHISAPVKTKRFRTQAFVNSDVYPSNSKQTKKFPVLNLKRNDTVRNPNRLVVLLLLAMDIKKEEEITEVQEFYINKILDATWNFLRTNVLSSNNEAEAGYKLDLLGDKVAYQIIDKAWVCPVNQVPLDTIFRGYSPLITSKISSNLEKYKITDSPVHYPFFPYAYRRDNEDVFIEDEIILKWIAVNMEKVRQRGLWSNMHERILMNNPVFLSAEHTAQQNKDDLRRIEEKFEHNELNILSCSTTMEMGVDISGISEVVMNNVPPKPANYLQRAGRAGRGSETKALALTYCAPNPIGANLFSNQKWAMTHKTAVPKVSFDSNMLVQRHVNSVLLASYITNDTENNLTVSSSVKAFFYPNENDTNHYNTFREYLNNIIFNGEVNLYESYKNLARSTCKQLISFEDSVSTCKASLEVIYKQLEDKKRMLDNKIQSLRDRQYNQDSPATRAINSQLQQILQQNILGFFAEHNFIPSAGIPTGIVEFDKYNIADYNVKYNNEGNEYNFGYQKVNPSMLLTQAITEYAPGNQIVLNEACYVSRGIVMKSQWNNARRVIFQYCSDCGYAIAREGDALSICPHCGKMNLNGIKGSNVNFVPLIEPAGFRVDFSEEPTRTINRTTKNYAQPELLNMPPWDEQDELSSTKFEMRFSYQTDAEILYYNLGNGCGYAICLECGRAVPDIDEERNEEAIKTLKLWDHRPIIGGKKEKNDKEHCSNNNIKRNVLLGGRFQTDFIEIRFKDTKKHLINNEETIYSLGVVLIQKLAEKIGINSQEINFGVKKYHNYTSIFIYDTAKGGAGYSIQFNDLQEEVLNLAKTTLENCTCDKACNKCLINRDSQWSLDKLNRKKALEWLILENNCRNQAPENIQIKFSKKVYSLTSNFPAEINKVLTNPDLSKITFFIDNNIEGWKPEEWEFYRIAKKLRQKGILVCFAFKQPTIDLKKLSASQLSVLAEMQMSFALNTYTANLNGLTTLIFAEFREKTISYFAESVTISDKFDETWAKGNANIYKVACEINMFTFAKWHPNFDFAQNDDKNIVFEVVVKDRNATSHTLASKITSVKSEKWKIIFDKIKDSQVDISYTDIYLKSPLSCRLLIDVIQWIKKKTNLQIDLLSLNLADFRDRKINDFDSIGKRDDYVTDYAENFDLSVNIIKPGKLPHRRELKIENDKCEFIIRPDGGFENGWKVDYAERNSDWEENFESDVRLYNTSMEGVLFYVVYKQK